MVATAAVFGLTYSLSAALIALDLAERGAPRSLIGINAAMHALGVLAIAPVLPRVVGRIGPRRMTLGALVVAAIVLALFPAMPGIWLWFPLRFLLGAASEALFTLSETWVNQLSEERTRARSMATYVAALSVGFALGPLILSAVGSAGATPYLIGAGLALAAALLIVSPRVIAPVFPKERPGNLLHLLRLAPVAIAAEGLNAGIETAGLTFLPLYAIAQGWTEEGGTRLISCLMFGAILLQLPIGWLGDRMDRLRLAIVLGLVTVGGALRLAAGPERSLDRVPGAVRLGRRVRRRLYADDGGGGQPLRGRRAGRHLRGDGAGLGRGRAARPGARRPGDGPLGARPADLRRARLPRLHDFRRDQPQRGA